MCGDANAMEWLMAMVEKKEPPEGKVGFIYMLAGGSDGSNTDPFAMEPAPGDEWVSTRAACHDRQRAGHDAGLSGGRQARYLQALCDVCEHALCASDDPGGIAGPGAARREVRFASAAFATPRTERASVAFRQRESDSSNHPK